MTDAICSDQLLSPRSRVSRAPSNHQFHLCKRAQAGTRTKRRGETQARARSFARHVRSRIAEQAQRHPNAQ